MEPNKQPPQSLPVLDEKNLGTLLQALGPKLQPILHHYKISSANYLKNMKIALGVNDIDEIARIAHALKGSSRTLSAIHLANQCQILETEIQNNNHDEISGLLNSIDTIPENTIEELSNFEKSTKLEAS